MKRPHLPRLRLRVRTLIVLVALVAVLIWGVMMGSRSLDYARLASQYGDQERHWRREATQGDFRREFCIECAAYFAQLTAKYRQAMWHPWRPVAPDPFAPGVKEYLEQERQAAGNP